VSVVQTQCDHCEVSVLILKTWCLEEIQVLGLKENADLVPQIHVALHTSMEQTPS
jgi:hypothetical protein